MAKFLAFLVLLSLCILGAGGFFYQKVQVFSEQKVAPQVATVIEYPQGTSLNRLSKDLASSGVVSNELLFKLWVKYFSDYTRFQAGNYRFEEALSPNEVIARFKQGDTYEPVVMEFTVPEGFTLKLLAARLAAKGVGTEQEVLALSKDTAFLSELGVRSLSLEGYIYPATYSFTEMPTVRQALKTAVQEFFNRLPEDYEQRLSEYDLSLNEAVIFASLIELETPHDFERPFVSEVIWRRLTKNAALAIDATVIYGIPDYDGNITRKHLRDAKNPYNSRIHVGLPPTAIGSPSLESLLAVLTPSKEGYYYYVVDVNSVSGNRHHFSKTLKEHNSYVRKLVRHAREQRLKNRKNKRKTE